MTSCEYDTQSLDSISHRVSISIISQLCYGTEIDLEEYRRWKVSINMDLTEITGEVTSDLRVEIIGEPL